MIAVHCSLAPRLEPGAQVDVTFCSDGFAPPSGPERCQPAAPNAARAASQRAGTPHALSFHNLPPGQPVHPDRCGGTFGSQRSKP